MPSTASQQEFKGAVRVGHLANYREAKAGGDIAAAAQWRGTMNKRPTALRVPLRSEPLIKLALQLEPGASDATLRAAAREVVATRIREIEADTSMSDTLKAAAIKWAGESLERFADPVERPRFTVLEAAEFAGDEYTEPEYLVHELLPRRGLGLAWGESGAGKSFYLLDLACAVSRGAQWRDRQVTKGRAVIICAEGEHSFPLRLKAYAKRHGASLADLPAVVPAAPNLFQQADVSELIGELRQRGAQLVIVDTLAASVLGADENSSRDMGTTLAHCKAIARELDALVLIVHHAGKDSSKGARGSSVLKPAVDVELAITGDGVTGVAEVAKLKDGARGARLGFSLVPVELGISRRTSKPFGSLIVEHTDAVRAFVKPERLPRGPVPRAMYAAIQHLCAGGEPAEIAAAYELTQKNSIGDLGDDGKLKPIRVDHLKRALDRLVSQKFVYVHGESRELVSLGTAERATDEEFEDVPE